jgi:hypothetical protein
MRTRHNDEEQAHHEAENHAFKVTVDKNKPAATKATRKETEPNA